MENKDQVEIEKLFRIDEIEYILAACEHMSCGFERTDDFMAHCCDLNEVVPKLRKILGIVGKEDD